MRVVHVSPAVFGPGKRGGGERYVSELFRAQRQLGTDVSVIEMPSPWAAGIFDEPGDPSRRLSLGATLSTLRSADIVHVHQLNTSAFDVAAVLRPISGFRLVLTDHGGGNLAPGRLLGNKRLRLVDAAAFVSNWSRNDVDPNGRIGTYSVVYGGGDHVEPVDSGTPSPTTYDFGFVGRLLPHKGPHIVIEALPDNASLIIAGEARDPEYLEHLKGLAVGKRVVFRHDVQDEEIGSLYKSLRNLVVPSVTEYEEKKYSRPELLGLVAIESLFHGTPVIGSRVGGLGELLEGIGQTVVEPGSVSAWNAALTTALDHGPAEPPTDSLTWETVAKKCLVLYSTALNPS